MNYEAPPRENIPARYAALKTEHVYCRGCGARMRLVVNTGYRFDRRTGDKTADYTIHSWTCPNYDGWWERHLGEDYTNPHDDVAIGGIVGGPAL